MTVRELYKKGVELLKANSVEDAEFDCDCLFERFAGHNRLSRVINHDADVDSQKETDFLNSVNRRLKGEPLQYILGKWEFMGFEFFVGEGVLIPRPETEIIVEQAVEYIKSHKNAGVYDLCAGSGAIGLSVARLCPECKVYLFEKYDGALEYLNKNRDKLNAVNASVVRYDLFDGFDSSIEAPDLILSNPPYIATQEISSLQREVGHEPETALDGGEDGLDFYRCIKDKWSDYIKPDGKLIMECGEFQSRDIANMFPKASAIEFIKDFNNIKRVVKIDF